MSDASLPTRVLGSTGQTVTTFGLGGEGVLRTEGMVSEAEAVISTAVQHGVSYFDSARAYAGSEGYYGRFWMRHPEVCSRVFITSNRNRAR